jgi:hypothetical protein
MAETIFQRTERLLRQRDTEIARLYDEKTYALARAEEWLQRITELEATNFELSVGLAAKSNKVAELEARILHPEGSSADTD